MKAAAHSYESVLHKPEDNMIWELATPVFARRWKSQRKATRSAETETENPRDIIERVRPALLKASQSADALSPSRAICLSSLLGNMCQLDASKLYVLNEVLAVLRD